jgi:hypothetical protein
MSLVTPVEVVLVDSDPAGIAHLEDLLGGGHVQEFHLSPARRLSDALDHVAGGAQDVQDPGPAAHRRSGLVPQFLLLQHDPAHGSRARAAVTPAPGRRTHRHAVQHAVLHHMDHALSGRRLIPNREDGSRGRQPARFLRPAVRPRVREHLHRHQQPGRVAGPVQRHLSARPHRQHLAVRRPDPMHRGKPVPRSTAELTRSSIRRRSCG